MSNAKPLWRIEKTAVTYGLVYILIGLSIRLVQHHSWEIFGFAIGSVSLPAILLVISGFIVGFDLFRSTHQKNRVRNLFKLALACSACAYFFTLIVAEVTGSSQNIVIIEHYLSHRGLVGNSFDFFGVGRELYYSSPLVQSPLDGVAHIIVALIVMFFSGFGIETSILLNLALLLLFHFLGMALCTALGLEIGQRIAQKRMQMTN